MSIYPLILHNGQLLPQADCHIPITTPALVGAGATAIATVMLVISFILLLIINGLQAWTKKTREAV